MCVKKRPQNTYPQAENTEIILSSNAALYIFIFCYYQLPTFSQKITPAFINKKTA
jgi:hypothetical protein